MRALDDLPLPLLLSSHSIPGTSLIAAFKPSQVRACLESVPFSEDVRTELLHLVRGTVDVNIFKYNEIGNDAAPNLAQNVDVYAERE